MIQAANASACSSGVTGARWQASPRERWASRFKLLADVSALLASVLELETALRHVARLLVPHLADTCRIELLGGEGQVCLIAWLDPTREDPQDAIDRRDVSLGRAIVASTTDEIDAATPRIEPETGARGANGEASGIGRLSPDHAAPSFSVVVPLQAEGRALGALSLTRRRGAGRFEDADLALIDEIGRLIGQAAHDALRLRSPHPVGAVHEAARASSSLTPERLPRLQRITAALARAVTSAEVEDVILNGAREALQASGASLWRIEDAEIHLARRTGHFDPSPRRFTRFIADSSFPVAQVLRDKQPIWIESAAQLEALLSGFEVPREGALHQAWAVIPLLTEEHAEGALLLSFAEPHRFTPGERRLLLAAASVCAQALARARVYDAEHDARLRAERAALRLARLRAIASSLSETLEADTVGRLIIDEVREALGANSGWLWTFDAAAEALSLVRGGEHSPEVRSFYTRIPLTSALPIAAAVRTGEAVWCASFAELRALYPSARISSSLAQGVSFVCLPLACGGRRLGGLTFTFDEGLSLSDDDRAFLQVLTPQCAQALERARLHEEARTTALRISLEITAQKRTEEDLREVDRRKDEFIATLSHELRNPLAPIRLATALLRARAPDEPRVRRPIEIIDRQVTQIVRLVDDLLEVSRIKQGKVVLQRESTSVEEIIERAVEASRPLIDAQRHELAVTLPARPTRLHGDAARLAQVVTNLLNNAAKYTDPGGRISLTASRDGGDFVLEVADTGAGIPGEMLGKIFDLFVQIDRSIDRSQGGLGIGLTLVKKLVEMHDGAIHARSDGRGKGSTFTVRLPALPDPADRAPRAAITWLHDEPR